MTATESDTSATTLSAKQAQGAHSREEILDAAENLMSARGYAATSISALAKESGLPASSIYWHFGSKSGVLGAVMERGSARFFSGVDTARILGEAVPKDRLRELLHSATDNIRTPPRFLRLLIVLLLGAEGEHAQHDVVARVRREGADRLRTALQRAYEPWGEQLAENVASELGDLALVMFDGIFLAIEAGNDCVEGLVEQAVNSLDALARNIRSN